MYIINNISIKEESSCNISFSLNEVPCFGVSGYQLKNMTCCLWKIKRAYKQWIRTQIHP